MVSSTINKIFYAGNGVASVFPYIFRIFLATHLEVYTIVESTGVITKLTYLTDYTVSGVGDLAGGNVTLVAGALASGTNLLVRRHLPLTQLSVFTNSGEFRLLTVEDALDYSMMCTQQLQEELDRCIKLNPAYDDSDFSGLFPSATITPIADGDKLEFDVTDGEVTVEVTS